MRRRILNTLRPAYSALGLAALAGALLAGAPAKAESLAQALAKAYLNNPDINQQRAGVRSVDEGVPKANAGYYPTINGEADIGLQRSVGAGQAPFAVTTQPRGFGLTLNQTLWNGGRVGNSVRQAETNVMSAREQMRLTEQSVLLNAATAYMDVMRDSAVLSLNKSNVAVLSEQLRQTKDRFDVGEVTRTDVAQAEASVAGAQSQVLTANSNLSASLANYQLYVGNAPKSLEPAGPITRALPKSSKEAQSIGQLEHPAVVGALHAVDAAEVAVKLAEGALYPTVGLTGSLSQRYDASNTQGFRGTTASVVGQVNIPIYQGGSEYAAIRQAKEALGQAELQADLARDKVRAAVVASWGANQNSLGVLRAAKAQVAAAEVALAGTREEAKVGQRTTLDVLNAQQILLNARQLLVQAQHDEVVNSYNLMSAIGRLSPSGLGLHVAAYDPRTHFDQVKDKLFGVRTPDGK